MRSGSRAHRSHSEVRAGTCASDGAETEAFAQDVLTLYSRAIELNQLNAAELLLQCLEALARESPDSGATLDAAYMRIVRR